MAETKILIVDDDRDLREALHSSLEAEHYTVFEAANGKTGLEAAELHKPKLILLDIDMPVMNGHEMLHELRKPANASWSKDIRILLLTNADDATNISQGISTGLKSDAYIIKSHTSLSEILKKVKQHLMGYYD